MAKKREDEPCAKVAETHGRNDRGTDHKQKAWRIQNTKFAQNKQVQTDNRQIINKTDANGKA